VAYVTNTNVTDGIICDPADCDLTVCDPNPPGGGQCLDQKLKNLAATTFHFDTAGGWSTGQMEFVSESSKYFLPLMLSVAGPTEQLEADEALDARIWVDRIVALPPGVRPSWDP
jgi:hypothetical protein